MMLSGITFLINDEDFPCDICEVRGDDEEIMEIIWTNRFRLDPDVVLRVEKFCQEPGIIQIVTVETETIKLIMTTRLQGHERGAEILRTEPIYSGFLCWRKQIGTREIYSDWWKYEMRFEVLESEIEGVE